MVVVVGVGRCEILDYPEISQCRGRERSNDNSSCQNFSLHRFPRQSCPSPASSNGLTEAFRKAGFPLPAGAPTQSA
jgi:hypothetical protein